MLECLRIGSISGGSDMLVRMDEKVIEQIPAMTDKDFKGLCLHLALCYSNIVCRNFDTYKIRSDTTVRLNEDLEFSLEFADYFKKTSNTLKTYYHYLSGRVMPWRQPVTSDETNDGVPKLTKFNYSQFILISDFKIVDRAVNSEFRQKHL